MEDLKIFRGTRGRPKEHTTVPGMEGVLNGVTVVLASGYLGQIWNEKSE